MPKNTYVARAGDTLQNISRKFYGVPTEIEKIIQVNPYLKFRRDAGQTDLNGIPNIQINDVVNVITELPDLEGLTVKALDDGELSMYVNNRRTSIPDGTQVTQSFDSCSNTFSSVFRWDYRDKLDFSLWGNPSSLPEVNFFLGSDQIIGGIFTDITYDPNPESPQVAVAGRTFTSKLQTSVIPLTKYPLERRGENLRQLLQWGVDGLGLSVKDYVNSKSKFKKAAPQKSQFIWDWFQEVAAQKNCVLHADNTGYALEIVRPIETEPTFYFKEGVHGFELEPVQYKNQELNETYFGSIKSNVRPSNSATFKSDFINNDTWGYIDLDNQNSGDAQENIEYLARKKLRDYFSVQFRQHGFLKPDGSKWKVGETISIESPSAAIFSPISYMVLDIEYNAMADNPHTVIVASLPQTYLGQKIEKLPWVL